MVCRIFFGSNQCQLEALEPARCAGAMAAASLALTAALLPWSSAFVRLNPWSELGPKVSLPVAAVARAALKPVVPVGTKFKLDMFVLTALMQDDDGDVITTDGVMVQNIVVTQTQEPLGAVIRDQILPQLAAKYRSVRRSGRDPVRLQVFSLQARCDRRLAGPCDRLPTSGG